MDRMEYIYYMFMKKIVEDGVLSLDESGLVLVLEERLGLSDDQMDRIMGLIEEGVSPDFDEGDISSIDEAEHMFEKDIYEKILNEACSDEKITDRELEILEELARIMNISDEEQKEIFRDVRCDADVSRRLGKALDIK